MTEAETRRAILSEVADFLMSDAETSCSWYELSEIIRNDKMRDVPTLSEVQREARLKAAHAAQDNDGGKQ